MLSKKLDDLYVCTNSKEISDLVNAHGGKSIITSLNIEMEQKNCRSGKKSKM